MQDGLYQVRWRNVCAGYVVENGKITMIAPVLATNHWLVKRAIRIGD